MHPNFAENLRPNFGRTALRGFPLTVSSAGSGRWGSGVTRKNPTSQMCSIELVTMGNALIVQDGRRHIVEPGGVYILHLGCAHEYGSGSAGFVHKRFAVLTGPSLESILRSAGLRTVDVLKPRDAHPVKDVLKRAARVLDERRTGWELELSTIAYRLVALLGQGRVSPYPQAVNRAIDFMEQRLTRSLWIEDMCAHVGLSPAHFSRVFRRHVGMAPIAYHQKQRMDWAQRMLAETALSVKEVAAAVGFEDPLYFSAQFKKVTGRAPSHVRGGWADQG